MKKYSSGSFVAAAYGVYGSEADTITSFPATIYADSENASATIYGNMQQSGTPTPTTPIYPTECGELVSSSYTIPIVSGGVTTSIDFNSVQSTRQIKKLVMTGLEDWSISSSWKKATTSVFYRAINDIKTESNYVRYVVSSHLSSGSRDEIYNNDIDLIGTSGSNTLTVRISDVVATTVSDFKTYLQQQYTNGTPVTVWYVLATPTTGIVNEPIRKIGDYVDSVAAAAIPTTAGSQTFNIDTTLKPSSVSLTYTGWHTHTDKQYSGGWGQVTSNAKVLRRKRTTKSKT